MVKPSVPRSRIEKKVVGVSGCGSAIDARDVCRCGEHPSWQSVVERLTVAGLPWYVTLRAIGRAQATASRYRARTLSEPARARMKGAHVKRSISALPCPGAIQRHDQGAT